MQAKAPSDVSDLIGVRASSGEQELRARGYSLTSSKTGSATKWGYWWNSSGNGAAVAIGAAAIIGALAIASSNKHKDREDNWNQYPGGSGVTPYELRYILGMKVKRAENELSDRRYKFATAGSGNYNRWGYWWNKREDSCIGVTYSGGRVESIVSTAPSYCGKGGSWGGSSANDSYSPARGVICYPAQRACYENGAGYSAFWTSREFRY